jgi:hypothetical protein
MVPPMFTEQRYGRKGIGFRGSTVRRIHVGTIPESLSDEACGSGSNFVVIKISES